MLPVVEFEGDAKDSRKNRVVKWEETKLCAAVKAGSKQAVYGFGESVEDLGLHWAQCVNLKHMIALRVLRANKQWDDYWHGLKAA